MSRAGREQAGRRAEGVAAWLLRLKGFRIVDRRYRTPVGEIDLVARRRQLVVFVEVKRRRDLATAAAAIQDHQRARIARAAEHWLAVNADVALVRFDAILVAPGTWPRHVVDAWRPEPFEGARP